MLNKKKLAVLSKTLLNDSSHRCSILNLNLRLEIDKITIFIELTFFLFCVSTLGSEES